MTTSSPDPLRLYLIRHGETEWSLSGRHTGCTDISLTANGEDEARALGRRLRDIPFEVVLTSPLKRARQTCTLVGLDKAADVEPDLAEWDYGDYEGQRSSYSFRPPHPNPPPQGGGSPAREVCARREARSSTGV